MRHAEQPVLFPAIGGEFHRRGKAAQQRQHGRRRHLFEGEYLLVLCQLQGAFGSATLRGFTGQMERKVFSFRADEPHGQRDVQRCLLRLPRRRRGGLRNRQLIGLVQRRVAAGHHEVRRAGLIIPALELRQVPARGFRHGIEEVLHRRGPAVIVAEIDVHPGTEGILTDNGLQHTDNFRSLLVYGSRVEVVDLDIACRAHRMGQRARIFRELVRAQRLYVGNAFHRARAHVGREFLVTEDRQTLLQAQLEPVAAGYAIAAPIVEILMRDDGFHIGEIHIGRGVGANQDVLVVEDVETLVLHRPHVEIRHGNDIEDIEVILAAERVLIPLHGSFERVHGVGSAVFLAVLHIDTQRHLAAGPGGKAVGHMGQVARHHGKEIGRLGMRVMPDSEMTAALKRAALHAIAIGQQHRAGCRVAFQANGIDRQNVRAVREIGYAAKPFRLALGAVDTIGPVETGERSVGLRVALRLDDDFMRALCEVRQHEAAVCQIIGASIKFIAVHADRQEGHPLPVQRKRCARGSIGIGQDPHRGPHAGAGGGEGHVQMHTFHQPGRWGVILKPDRLRGGRRCGRSALGHGAQDGSCGLQVQDNWDA